MRDCDVVIRLDDVSVQYRRYLRRVTTLKDFFVTAFRASHYDSFWGLKNVSLSVKRGERLGVCGPNGAGKSTLLKVIANLMEPATGRVEVSGRVVPMMQLGAGFRGDLTGRENVFLNGAIMGFTPKQMRERMDRIIDFAGIGDFIDAPMSTYSSGMKTRLGFAVSIDVEPDILLLDEVMAAGDAEFRAKASERINHFFENGTTVILVSHSPADLKRLCDRAIYINRGEILANGAVSDVLDAYLKPQAAAPAPKVASV